MTKIAIGKYKQDMKPNPEGTEMAFDFFVNAFKVNGLSHFFIHLVGRSEKLDSLIRDVKSALNRDSTELNNLEDVISAINFRWIDQFHFHEAAFSEMTFCRTVDLFSIFLDELLLFVLKNQPESLKSNEKLTSEEVLSCSNMEEVIDTIARRKVREISYRSIKDRLNYFDEKLGFRLGLTPEHIKDITLLYECRNLLVHNKGIVNSIFKRKVGESSLQEGDVIDVDTDLASTSMQCISNAVKIIDSDITKKIPASKLIASQDEFITELSNILGRTDKFSSEVREFVTENSNKKKQSDD